MKKLLLSLILFPVLLEAQVRVAVVTTTNGTLLAPTNFFATNVSAMVSGLNVGTNSITFRQMEFIPTNSIPLSSTSATNWVLVNLTNRGPVFVATNNAVSGSFLIRTPTTADAIWP